MQQSLAGGWHMRYKAKDSDALKATLAGANCEVSCRVANKDTDFFKTQFGRK